MKTICLMFLIFCIGGCTTLQKKKFADHPCSHLIEWFKSADNNNSPKPAGVPDITACFKNNKTDYNIAVAIIQENGFAVTSKSRSQNPEYFEGYVGDPNLQPEDDIYVYAYKINKLFRLRATNYGLKLYIRNGFVDRAYGVVNYAYPPL